jgi:hypothetical protein
MADNFTDYVDAGLTSDVPAWNGEAQLTPPGDYEFSIAEVKRTTSSAGNPQLQVKFEVQRNADGSDTPYKGRAVMGWYQETGEGRMRLKNLIQASGVELDARGGFSLSALTGKHLLATVKADSYVKVSAGADGEPTKETKNTVKISKERAAK